MYSRVLVVVLALVWPVTAVAAVVATESAWGIAAVAVPYWFAAVAILRATGWSARTLALATGVSVAWYALVLPFGIHGSCYLEQGANIVCPGMEDKWRLFWMVGLGFPLALGLVALAPRIRRQANA